MQYRKPYHSTRNRGRLEFGQVGGGNAAVSYLSCEQLAKPDPAPFIRSPKKSPPVEANRSMTSPRHFIQTPFDMLQDASNDYSRAERQFQRCGGVFIDLGEDSLARLGPTIREETKIEHSALRQRFLKLQENVPFLTVIMNVAGCPRMFADVLRSLAQQTFVSRFPDRVELVLVQDGPDGVLDEPAQGDVLA